MSVRRKATVRKKIAQQMLGASIDVDLWAALSTNAVNKALSDSLTGFIRRSMLEDSFMRMTMPPTPILLNPSTLDDIRAWDMHPRDDLTIGVVEASWKRFLNTGYLVPFVSVVEVEKIKGRDQGLKALFEIVHEDPINVYGKRARKWIARLRNKGVFKYEWFETHIYGVVPASVLDNARKCVEHEPNPHAAKVIPGVGWVDRPESLSKWVEDFLCETVLYALNESAQKEGSSDVFPSGKWRLSMSNKHDHICPDGHVPFHLVGNP